MKINEAEKLLKEESKNVVKNGFMLRRGVLKSIMDSLNEELVSSDDNYSINKFDNRYIITFKDEITNELKRVKAISINKNSTKFTVFYLDHSKKEIEFAELMNIKNIVIKSAIKDVLKMVYNSKG